MDLSFVKEEDVLYRIARLELRVDRLQNTTHEAQNEIGCGAPLLPILLAAHTDIIERLRKLNLHQHTTIPRVGNGFTHEALIAGHAHNTQESGHSQDCDCF